MVNREGSQASRTNRKLIPLASKKSIFAICFPSLTGDSRFSPQGTYLPATRTQYLPRQITSFLPIINFLSCLFPIAPQSNGLHIFFNVIYIYDIKTQSMSYNHSAGPGSGPQVVTSKAPFFVIFLMATWLEYVDTSGLSCFF